jgi:hypothetical protein
MHMKILLRCFVILALALPAVCQDTATFGGNSQHTGRSGETKHGVVRGAGPGGLCGQPGRQSLCPNVEGWRTVVRVVNFPRTFYDDATLLFPFRA